MIVALCVAVMQIGLAGELPALCACVPRVARNRPQWPLVVAASLVFLPECRERSVGVVRLPVVVVC